VPDQAYSVWTRSDAPMPTPSHQRSRKRVSKPDRRRALELLASSPDGCTEGLMIANGFTVELLLAFETLAGLGLLPTRKHAVDTTRLLDQGGVRAHQPGSEPIDIPETIPNPVVVPKPTPTPTEPAPKEPVRIPEKVP
jgi:hypothetical protein